MSVKRNSDAGRPGSGRHRGFTLVEVVATAVILFIGALGILALTRTGRQIDISTLHRRAARNIIISEFELIRYHHIKYQDRKNEVGTTSRLVSVDHRGTPGDSSDDLTGTLSITIGTEQTVSSGGSTVPFLPVTMTLAWNEPEGPDTVSLTKRIAEAE